MADEAGFKEVVRKELHKLKPEIVASPSFSNGLRKVREQVARALGEGRFLEALALGDALVAIDPATCPNHRARGGALMEMGRLAESLQALDEAAKVHPNCASVLSNRAATLERMGQLDAAVESARRAAAIVPRNASTKGTLAYYLRKAGRVQEALAAAESAIDQDRTSLYGWSPKVECLLGLGRAEEALRASEEAVRLTKAQPAALLLQGFALHGAGRHPEGLALVRQAMGGVSESKLWRHAGDMLMEMREPAEARWAYQEAVGLSPGNALAWVQLSRASAALGDNDGSIAALQQALGLGHAVARVRNELAVRLLNKLEFEEGLIHSKAAAEAEPQTWQSVSTYALALSFCGQRGKAFRLLEGILDRTPTSADILLEAAIICLNGGQGEKAGRFLEEAKGKPDFPQRTVEYAGLLRHLGMDSRAPAVPPGAPNRAATPAFLEEPSGLTAP
ncbi:MAG: tetratricopeptide repeat protein [Halobacteriales archaeon]|nr:tetratricopeptide repeat protein [Halobacteriales archaeon]